MKRGPRTDAERKNERTLYARYRSVGGCGKCGQPCFPYAHCRRHRQMIAVSSLKRWNVTGLVTRQGKATVHVFDCRWCHVTVEAGYADRRRSFCSYSCKRKDYVKRRADRQHVTNGYETLGRTLPTVGATVFPRVAHAPEGNAWDGGDHAR